MCIVFGFVFVGIVFLILMVCILVLLVSEILVSIVNVSIVVDYQRIVDYFVQKVVCYDVEVVLYDKMVCFYVSCLRGDVVVM